MRAGRALLEHLRSTPGRGGCGIGAIASLNGAATHKLLQHALTGLSAMEHRGGAIEDTGDGAGLLLVVDPGFFARFIAPDRRLPERHSLSVGVLYFPAGEDASIPHWQRSIDVVLRRHGLKPLGWRRVPIDLRALGRKAVESHRDVWQVLIGEGLVRVEDLHRTLHRVKARIEREVRDVYVPSFSAHTVVYKALATGPQLGQFFPDLTDPELRTRAVVFHRRYATNTFSNWYLAQPFRTLCHNGEINTIAANRNALRNLQRQLGRGALLMPQGSDSADLDRVVELFRVADVSLLETVARLMPPAWRDVPDLPPEVVRFHRGVQRALGSLGAWEGPASLIATDGQLLVAALDRMGLRPLRYVVSRRGHVIITSEIGAVPVDPEDMVETGQLGPGEQLGVDLRSGALLRPREIARRVVAETRINFGELSEKRLLPLPQRANAVSPPPHRDALARFGWTRDRQRVVRQMAKGGKEPITSMGHDRPLPVMSTARPPLTKYFKQIVAVVTNPPIDPIREGSAFDSTVHLGAAPQVHSGEPVYDPLPQYELPSPILTTDQLRTIIDGNGGSGPKAFVLDATFDDPHNGSASGAKAISRRIAELRREGLEMVKRGAAEILVLSDRGAVRAAEGGELSRRLPVPMVIVASALVDALVTEGHRRRCGIVVDTGAVQEGHDVAVLIGNGVDAVHPFLLFEIGTEHGPVLNLVRALEASLRRIMSKMGICSVDGYRGSRLFEAVGISADLVDHYFPGVTSLLGGIDLEDVYEDIAARAGVGDAPAPEPDTAIYRKEVWRALQETARGLDAGAWERFTAAIDTTPPVYLRDLLRLRTVESPGEVEAVASVEEIVRQVFRGAAMSHGALHRVAHRAIAAAFNDLGALSNCGEGGEDPRRDRGGEWEASRSRIRQVASGRFGVEARYLVNADEIEIKIGQGAKPGEGGMLPAAKVTAEVARIRRTQPGVTLISPPPHHDIYSIEDLAQLIYNLRQTNARAMIGVKLPAVTDIGMIAVGVAKAGADAITISGAAGGTGAAAKSSIEHAGLPLERALAETHQALVLSGIRSRVVLRADGGIKTGFDVVSLLCMGADQVSLGTALMIAEQCVFCHGCAAGNCPAGITTQDPDVAQRLMTGRRRGGAVVGDDGDIDERREQERYADARRAIQRYLLVLAGDVRRKMADLGVRRTAQVVGRVDLLERLPEEQQPARCRKLDLSALRSDPYGTSYIGIARGASDRRFHDPTSATNARVVRAAAKGARSIELELTNRDHAVGATLAGALAAGETTLACDTFVLQCRGWAGQALGFALVDRLRIEHEGFANDTVGEAMSGGIVVVRASQSLSPAERSGHARVGNSIAYGATGGTVLVEGSGGQRVGVRNSGATIVIEGAGKYAFEYMTGGVGVVLGPVGPVVGSGLTGGCVFVLAGECPTAHVNSDSRMEELTDADRDSLRDLVELHHRETGSHRAASLLEDWTTRAAELRKLVPAR